MLLYYRWIDDEAMFYERTDQGEYIEATKKYNIKIEPWDAKQQLNRLWLIRNYDDILKSMAHKEMKDMHYSDTELAQKMTQLSARYGEITISINGKDNKSKKFDNTAWIYSDQFGLKKDK